MRVLEANQIFRLWSRATLTAHPNHTLHRHKYGLFNTLMLTSQLGIIHLYSYYLLSLIFAKVLFLVRICLSRRGFKWELHISLSMMKLEASLSMLNQYYRQWRCTIDNGNEWQILIINSGIGQSILTSSQAPSYARRLQPETTTDSLTR